MTRRGSIAYYLAAAVCGSFFLAASYYGYFLWAGSSSQHWGRDFFFLYFFGLLFGVVPLILSAWALRRVAAWLGWRQGGQWLLAGTGIFVTVIWGLGRLGIALTDAVFPGVMTLMPLLGGPMFAALYPPWIPLPAAIATAWVLHSVHRAFEEQK